MLGEWRLANGKIELDSRAPAKPGVYAFVLDGVVVYVGVTQNGLRTRINQYRQGHSGQRTSARVNGLIRQALEAGQRVAAMIAIPPALEWKGLPVDGSAGLEVGLIELIQPVWNMRGVT
jgi:excinuclease UvrABC nuclease subunit